MRQLVSRLLNHPATASSFAKQFVRLMPCGGFLLLTVMLCLAGIQPSWAQFSPTGLSNTPGSPGGAPQPRPREPETAPPGVPGAPQTPLISPQSPTNKPVTGDPTAALFTAIDKNDYSAAQDALSRGALLTAQNSLGETPLDLSVALNRSSITFLLLAARNESGLIVTTPAATNGKAASIQHSVLPVAKVRQPTQPVSRTTGTSSPGNPGVPNASAGFLGFGAKN